MKRIVLILLCFLLMITGIMMPVYAEGEEVSGSARADQKVQEQNEVLKEKLDELYDESDERARFDHLITTNKDPGTKLNRDNIYRFFMHLSLSSRRVAVPAFVLLMVTYAIAISWLGSRSKQIQRFYMVMSISMTIFFLFLINLPILLILHNTAESLYTMDNAIKLMYATLNFLSVNSVIIWAVMVISAIDKRILNVSDVPDRMQGSYLIQGAFAFLVFINVIPFVLQYIV